MQQHSFEGYNPGLFTLTDVWDYETSVQNGAAVFEGFTLNGWWYVARV